MNSKIVVFPAKLHPNKKNIKEFLKRKFYNIY